MIDIHEVDPGIAVAVQRQFHQHLAVDWRSGTEVYYAPDFTLALDMRERWEFAFGIRICSARIMIVDAERKFRKCLARFVLRRFASPGAFGRHYDHWSGSPWSPDSKQVALVELTDSDPGSQAYWLRHYDVGTRRWQGFAKGESCLGHQAWSSDGEAYLYRTLTQWRLVSVKTGTTNVVCEQDVVPKHCHFTVDGKKLLLIDRQNNLALLDRESLQTVDSLALNPILGGTVDFSLPDPQRNVLLLGLESEYGDFATSRRVFAASTMNA
jgi:dipeptidyl aminopeptidase/acylaminoacyl peptidase